MMNSNILQQDVFIDSATHTYYDNSGEQYTSMTRVIKEFVPKVDFKIMAFYVAQKRFKYFTELSNLHNYPIDVIASKQPVFERGYTVETILREWEYKRNLAATNGTLVHKNLELAGLYGTKTNDKYLHYYEWFIGETANIEHKYFEQILYSKKYNIAGTLDKCNFRAGKKSMFNIRDFKTNDYNYDCDKLDNVSGVMKRYERYFKAPLDHLECSDYNKFCLQLSGYMFMAEEILGIKPGNMAIIHVPCNNIIDIPQYQYIPYMKYEVEAMFEAFRSSLKTKYIKVI